jgi:hypothetical protein
MKAKECGLTILGILSLFWPWASVKPFVDDDLGAELETNQFLAARPQAEIDGRRQQ